MFISRTVITVLRMPKPGYVTVTLKEEVYKKLETMRKKKGLKSVAQVIGELTKSR